MQAPADHQALAQRLELAGRQRIAGDEQIVQARGAGQAGIERRLEHAGIGGERPLGVRERDVLEKAFRADPGPALEDALEVERRQPGLLGHRLERGLLLAVLDDVAERGRDPGVVGHVASGRGLLDQREMGGHGLDS